MTLKAFDWFSWPFLYRALEGLGFSGNVVSCIQSLYSNPSVRIKINGPLTDSSKLFGTRQGYCLSPTLFAVYSLEPLAQAIPQNKELTGITIATDEHIMGLFEDNIITYLKDPNSTLLKLSNVMQSDRHKWEAKFRKYL